jgi:hypothetical protein
MLTAEEQPQQLAPHSFAIGDSSAARVVGRKNLRGPNADRR